MPMPSGPKAKLRARIAFLCLFLAFVGLSIGAYYIGDLGRFLPGTAARETHSALQALGDTGRMGAAPGPHPANPFQQLLAMATRAADDADMASEKLSSEVERPAISGDINLGTASRAELETLRGNLKTAEANATAFMPRYAALLKTERDTVENDARALHVEKESAGRLLDQLDRRQAEMTALMARLMSARAEFYGAYENYVAVLAGEFGNYKVVDGQFIFPFQRSVDRYNVAGHAMTVAARSVAELEQERQNLKQSQQAAWLRFVNGQ
jgi:hypothetical protein